MIGIIALLFAGIFVGVLLRRFSFVGLVPKLIAALILLLLFSLGISVGKNEDVMNNLSTLGLQALIITLAALAGSIFFAWIVYKYLWKDKIVKQTNNVDK